MKITQNSNTILVQLYMYLYPYDFMKHTQNSNTVRASIAPTHPTPRRTRKRAQPPTHLPVAVRCLLCNRQDVTQLYTYVQCVW